MFVDAAAIIAILSEEAEADRCAEAISGADHRVTSALAAWEAVKALSRPDKLAADLEACETLVRRFLNQRGINLIELPPAQETLALSVLAATRYGSGRRRLNLADCFHYACAKHFGMPILSTADEFRFTDLETVP